MAAPTGAALTFVWLLYIGCPTLVSRQYRKIHRQADALCHPYTEALLAAVPIPNPQLKRRKQLLQGDVPSPINPPYAEARCQDRHSGATRNQSRPHGCLSPTLPRGWPKMKGEFSTGDDNPLW